ncbi:hypothetical protein C9I90_09475 [Photobacterium aphoticum]|uniref:Uncharacterized protein n=1 Tax=Photobacterium aphoticum TaxID=754436 RepID=A0A0J1JAR6_9GAMM|nr:hypothetical protein ABT58_21780 [Photobacterium aphoticum]PSU57531.1 hypothetical protein C9I90_09475 [Photobacterium aphoticum]
MINRLAIGIASRFFLPDNQVKLEFAKYLCDEEISGFHEMIQIFYLTWKYCGYITNTFRVTNENVWVINFNFISVSLHTHILITCVHFHKFYFW